MCTGTPVVSAAERGLVITFDKVLSQYKADIYANGGHHHLGVFKTPQAAQDSFDIFFAAKQYVEENNATLLAGLNQPKLWSVLPPHAMRAYHQCAYMPSVWPDGGRFWRQRQEDEKLLRKLSCCSAGRGSAGCTCL